MTPVAYFFLFFENQVIDLIRNQTELYAAKTRYRAKMYGKGYQALHCGFPLFRSFEITAIQNGMEQKI